MKKLITVLFASVALGGCHLHHHHNSGPPIALMHQSGGFTGSNGGFIHSTPPLVSTPVTVMTPPLVIPLIPEDRARLGLNPPF